jgi:hypothetical protein
MRTAVAVAVMVFFACGAFLAFAQPELLVQLLGLVSVVAAVGFFAMGVVETVRWVARAARPARRLS